eukprot:GHVU01176813.1.p1 GENE.GHVU01176813.1~~GHVU01176813.1.p1  ORF type:complete len:306 (+),score=38.50 GHVU01176813.1:1-918(+)
MHVCVHVCTRICMQYGCALTHSCVFMCVRVSRFAELRNSFPVYVRELSIHALRFTFSIRTSEKRIYRDILHIIDALPVDTPYMQMIFSAEHREHIVCSWRALYHVLTNAYFKQLIQRSLPAAWLQNPFAFIVGPARGLQSLDTEYKRAVETSKLNCLEAGLGGIRRGSVMFFLNSGGGCFHSLAHIINLLHKGMGGSRKRPTGVLQAVWTGIEGCVLDWFYTPWVALFTEPPNIMHKDGWGKCIGITFLLILRCLVFPIFGLLHFFASVTEGLANYLVNDFEQYSRVQDSPPAASAEQTDRDGDR